MKIQEPDSHFRKDKQQKLNQYLAKNKLACWPDNMQQTGQLFENFKTRADVNRFKIVTSIPLNWEDSL